MGNLLSDLVIEVKSLDVSSVMDEGILDKIPIIKNAVHSLKKLKERYTKAEVQIDRIEEIKQDTIPSLQAEAAASGNPMDAQLVKDFLDTVDRFEKKIYDLELSRAISIQTVPQIKLIQNNDRVLVDKVQTAILNTIPIWKSQFVIALGLSNQQRVLKMHKEITETTNAMLVKNAELLKSNTVEAAKVELQRIEGKLKSKLLEIQR